MKIAWSCFASFGVCFFSWSIAQADNWAHWRGPTGNGVALSGKPPTEWTATKNVKWKVSIPGRGSGSPVVWEDQVFVVTAVPKGGSGQIRSNEDSGRAAVQGRPQRGNRTSGGRGSASRGRRAGAPAAREELEFKLLCFQRDDGRLMWEKTAVRATPHQDTHSTNGFSSASPCTDGQHVYAHFGSRGIFCYTLSGQLVWKRDDLGKMTTRNSFGEGSSPTLVGSMIIVPWDHEGPSSLMALNKKTGETIWSVQRDEPTCWATPLIVEHNGKKQVVMNGQHYARSYDLESGNELWRCSGQTERPVASAVAGNGLIYVGSGFRGAFLGAFRPDGRGDIRGTPNVAWSLSRDTPDIASPLLSEDRLYFHKGKSGMLTCVDANSGKPYYSSVRLPNLDSIYASPIAAGGHVYLTARNGTTVVIEDGTKLNIVAENSVGETVDATPAPVDDQLFIRGERHLFCIAE